MTTTIVYHILGWVLPIALTPLVYAASRALLNAGRRIDNLPPIVKRLIVGAVGTALASGFAALGVSLPPECGGIIADFGPCADALSLPVVVQGIAAALAAMFIHAVKKEDPRA